MQRERAAPIAWNVEMIEPVVVVSLRSTLALKHYTFEIAPFAPVADDVTGFGRSLGTNFRMGSCKSYMKVCSAV